MAEKRDTKEKILRAALEMFTESSYSTVTIDDIAKRAGVSKGGVFHYFDSKLQLAKKALVLGMKVLWAKNIDEQLDRCKTPAEKVWVIIDNSLSGIIEQSKLMRFINDMYTYCKDESGTMESIKNIWEEHIKIVETTLSEVGVSNPELKSRILCACMDGLIYQILTFQELKINLDSLKKEIYALFIK